VVSVEEKKGGRAETQTSAQVCLRFGVRRW
jgi:hypothetical protein